MKNVSIIGAGLIGGSLGLALKSKAGRKYRVTAVGRNPVKLRLAKKMRAADSFTTDIGEGVSGADIIVVCTPVDLIAPTVKKLLPFVKPGAVITDAGGAKGRVVKDVKKLFAAAKGPGRSASFVGAHPMAGSEKYGITAAKAGLYASATVALTPEKATPKKAVAEVAGMWKAAGAKVVYMSPAEHDRIVALVSHLPHVLAFNLNLALEKLERGIPGAARLAAGSFRDMTRIASSNTRDWAVICGANRAEIAKAIDGFIKELMTVKKILANTGKAEERFEKAKAARQKLLNIVK
jgi:prephenate dehydrogenase